MKQIMPMIFAWVALTTTANAASFDCSKARTKIEKMICDSKSISALDSKLADEYTKALAQACDAAQVKKVQRGWLKSRDTSETVKDLTSMYEDQLKWFVSKDTHPMDKYSVINPNLSKYKFDIHRSGCVQYLSYPPQAYDITISAPSGIQSQKLTIQSSATQDQLLSIVDMDGDGSKDLYLNRGYGAGPFPFTSVYIFNPDAKQFEEDKAFPQGATPGEILGCVYVEERMSEGPANYDYWITEWCRDKETKGWKRGKACSMKNDKECYTKLDNYKNDWLKHHLVE